MHEAGFDRLVMLADEAAGMVSAPWVAQIGHSSVVPKNMEWFRFLDKEQYDRYFDASEIIISHGGYTVVESILKGKTVIAVPRRQRYGEHIDDHQVAFVDWLESRGLARRAETLEELLDAIKSRRSVSPEALAEVLARRERLRQYIGATVHRLQAGGARGHE